MLDLGGNQQISLTVVTRIGHSGTRAAMTYQHATRERDQAIATALNALIQVARGKITN